jgi:hypothetical protein
VKAAVTKFEDDEEGEVEPPAPGSTAGNLKLIYRGLVLEDGKVGVDTAASCCRSLCLPTCQPPVLSLGFFCC